MQSNPNTIIILIAVIGVLPLFDNAFAQTIIPVNNTTPCFLNYTAGPDIWENCGMGEDYIRTALLPWEWVTGGHFSMMFAGVLIMFTYIKYHKAVYPILIGVFMLPISYFVFPESFLSWSILMAFVTVGILIWYVYIKQTKEY